MNANAIKSLMKTLPFLFLCFLAVSCHNYELEEDDFAGISLKGPNHTQKVEFNIAAKSKCSGKIIVMLNGQPFEFPFNGYIDTIYRTDWYSNENFVKVTCDSCVNPAPQVSIRFLNLNGM